MMIIKSIINGFKVTVGTIFSVLFLGYGEEELICDSVESE